MAKRKRTMDPEAQFQRAFRMLARGQHRQARQQLEQLLPLAQDHPTLQQIHLALADACLSLRDLPAAIDHAAKVLELNPDNYYAHYFLGFAYSLQSDWTQAIPPLRRAMELNPKDPEYYRALGWALYNQAETKEEGQALLEQALHLAPAHVPTLTDLAMLHGQEQRFDQALLFARRAVQLAPSDPMAQNVLAGLSHFKQEFERLGGQPPGPKPPARPATEAEWRELIAATDEFNQLVQLWLDLHPVKDIDEANASLRELNELWNSTPRQELGGRSPNQMMGR